MPCKDPVKRKEYEDKRRVERNNNGYWKEYINRPKVKETRKQYVKTKAVKEMRARYNKTPKGRAIMKLSSRKNKLANYGLTLESYDELYKKQLGLCALCHNPFGKKSPCIDHCHATNKVRGLLHSNCNTMLGMAKDSIEKLELAIEYLEKNRYSDNKQSSQETKPIHCCRSGTSKPTTREVQLVKYGMTLDGYNQMYMEQLGLCALCHEPFGDKTPNIEHCHVTNKVRGLTHGNCNTMLGMAKDSIEKLELAIEYLKKTASITLSQPPIVN